MTGPGSAQTFPRQPSSGRPYGFVEWFRIGEVERVETALAGMLEAGASWLRTGVSWADLHTAEGAAWYDWLLPRLGRAIDLLPCVLYTPPSLSRTGRTSGAPVRLRDYADFLDLLLDRYGDHFGQVELWNEPNNLLDWDWRDDADWQLFCEMIGAAAHWVEHRGWKAVLAGASPFDPQWLELMGERGLLGTVSAVGFHGFPGTWDSDAAEGGAWLGWHRHLADMRAIVHRFNPKAEIWITEAGYSTWRHDEPEQIDRFLSAMAAPAERIYWYGWQDIPHHVPVQEGAYFDPRHYHMGVSTAAGRHKLLARHLIRGGIPAVAEVQSLARPALNRGAGASVVIGGAGFIGANLADSLLRDGKDVVIVDNLSRPGVERNLAWLRHCHPSRLDVAAVDIRQPGALDPVIADADAVFHMAAQVAVTTSLEDPAEDFAVNVRGTLNVLEALRRSPRRTGLIMASTNKVYGSLDDLALDEQADHYRPSDPAIGRQGVDETRPLAFCTPYGCSKGAADQYALDYASSFGLPTAVLRMSCIYGPRQFGTEDQGWVAHFLIRALNEEPITIYGDGKQVRDILFVSDAVRAYRLAMAAIDDLAGQAFNLGGGPLNAVSLTMALSEIARLTGRPPIVRHLPWRPSDQLFFVADTQKLERSVGWRPTVPWREGVARLAEWLVRSGQVRPAPKRTPRGVALPHHHRRISA